jgi:hypothetical protein
VNPGKSWKILENPGIQDFNNPGKSWKIMESMIFRILENPGSIIMENHGNPGNHG